MQPCYNLKLCFIPITAVHLCLYSAMGHFMTHILSPGHFSSKTWLSGGLSGNQNLQCVANRDWPPQNRSAYQNLADFCSKTQSILKNFDMKQKLKYFENSSPCQSALSVVPPVRMGDRGRWWGDRRYEGCGAMCWVPPVGWWAGRVVGS